jgi:peroxiredoxin Q/BCP
LFFYPGDGTPVCTAEACAFRDAYTSFTDAGAVVVGVSADSLDSHREFAANHRLPFLMLSDADGQIRKVFGVPKTLGIFPGRVTYVIDKQGVVRHIFSSQLGASRHVAEALKIVEQLAREAA